MLHSRKLNQISTAEIQRFIDQLKIRYTPVTANRHLSLISRILKLAVTKGLSR